MEMTLENMIDALTMYYEASGYGIFTKEKSKDVNLKIFMSFTKVLLPII